MLRSSILTSPAHLTWGGYSFYPKGPIMMPVALETATIGTDAHGPLDERLLDFDAKVVANASGSWTALGRAALWPYRNTRPGASLAAGDPNLVIHAINEEKYTAECAVLTRMPSLFLGARETMIGEAEWTLLRKDNTPFTTADGLIIRETGQAYTDIPAFTVASLKTQPYTGVWLDVTGFTDIQTEDGWSVDFELATAPSNSDANGRIDIRFVSLVVRASCVPLNVDPDNIETKLHYQGAASLIRGGSIQAKGAQLAITGADGTTGITIANAGLVRGGYRFGSNIYRQDMISWISTRILASGAPEPLFTLA